MYNSFSQSFRKHIKLHHVVGRGSDSFYENLPASDVYEWCKMVEANTKEKAFRFGVSYGMGVATIVWLVIFVITR